MKNTKQTIRPQTLQEFVGKPELIHNLKTFISAAKQRDTPLDHILFYGLPGTGKTTLAHIIANELGKKIKVIQGTHLKKNIDVINLISLVNPGDIIFIDEVQAVSMECMETLYGVMEDFCIDIMIGKDNDSKVTRLPLPHFTLIAATTSIGELPTPLEERFEISMFLDSYDEDEILKILRMNMKKMDLELTDEELNTISSHCKGIPRIANKILKRVCDFKKVETNLSLSEILNKLEIYEYGLLKVDLIYLRALLTSGDHVGLKTLISLTQLDQKTIESSIEPFLLRNNLITKTCNGRMLTQKGENIIHKKIEENVISL